MRTLKLVKIGTEGKPLRDDATEWVAVLLADHGLMFSAASVVDRDLPHEKCVAACSALTLAGFSDWSLPEVEELELLVDRTRHNPAINMDFFPTTESDWYWSSTAAAWSSASAWVVLFHNGSVGDHRRSGGGFALAVRRPGQLLAL